MRTRRSFPLTPAHLLSLLALAAAALPASASQGVPGDAYPIVTTQPGKLEGKRGGGIESFLGVPFAAPPIGALRWRAPQPVAPWQGLRKADEYGPDCMQWGLDEPPTPAYLRPTSEDCLTLNLWRPNGTKRTGKLPVMVWIYGGAFSMGSASWPVYEGANLAREGVIVVAVNYRLARFGWFAHPALSAEDKDGVLGNYGLMDQMAGLRWVQDNIAAFGGDPDNVTVFGESAGAFSVNALMASPKAGGLFARAISQSGGGQKGFGRRLDTYMPEAEQSGLDWTRSLGIADTDLAAMRALPAATVLGPKNPLVLGGIIIDGRIVPQPVDEAFMKGDIARIPYMVGANSWEDSLLKYIPGAEAAVMPAMGGSAQRLLAMYEKGGAVPRKEAMQHLWGDAFMTAPARYLARRSAATGQPTYLYRFSYVPVAARGKIPGARHSAEISLAMRNQVTGAQFEEGAADTPMAQDMSGYWLRFARTGNPNGKGALAWPRYDAKSDRLMEFADQGPAVRAQFRKEAFDMMDAAYLARAKLAEAAP
ncbi:MULTISPECIES: carboxylesterase/lipase family protein [unclassified Novosphingobium]|uniref:carboxylesterase/lipase family protein n=1 Tax=unclassified Novosphingobium TaxID=2644732 RepID=UPI001356AEAD|nr:MULTISPECIES: carboxylesterase family protein [unclassified Novosphingobium]